MTFFAATFFPDTPATAWIYQVSFTSPFAAAFNLPIDTGHAPHEGAPARLVVLRLLSRLLRPVDGAALATMAWLFNVRWRMD